MLPLAVPEMRMLAVRFAAFRPLRLFALPVSATGGGRAQSPNEARPTALLRMGENGAKRHSRGAAEKGGGRYGYEPTRCATSRYSIVILYSIVVAFSIVAPLRGLRLKHSRSAHYHFA